MRPGMQRQEGSHSVSSRKSLSRSLPRSLSMPHEGSEWGAAVSATVSATVTDGHGHRRILSILAFLAWAALCSTTTVSADERSDGANPQDARVEAKAGAEATEVSAFTDAMARNLLARAAEVDGRAAQAALTLGYKRPPAQNASLTLLAAMWHDIAPKGIEREADLRFHVKQPRTELIKHLLEKTPDASDGSNAVSLLTAGALRLIVIQQQGTQVEGRASFEHAGVCDGRVAFHGRFANGAWTLHRLTFPETGIGLVLRNGTWTYTGESDSWRGATRRLPGAIVLRKGLVNIPPKAKAPLRERPLKEEREEGPDDDVRPQNHRLNAKIDTRISAVYNDALRWLAAHQSPEGHWSAATFHTVCDGNVLPKARQLQKPGIGKSLYDVGVTGLALQAFLGAGYTNRGKHPFVKTVTKGLRFLKRVQDKEGCFGKRTTQQYVYNHAMSALAMVEAYGLTGSPLFKSSAQRALDFIALARNPYFGWRYGIKTGENDTSMTCANYVVLDAAQRINRRAVARKKKAPLTIDGSAADGVRAWLQKVTDADTGRVGYISRGTPPARPAEMLDKFPGEKSEAMTAAAVYVQLRMGRKSTDKPIAKGLKLLHYLRPQWDTKNGNVDMYYWFYGTAAAHEAGGEDWHDWRRAMSDAILKSVITDGEYCGSKGSWDPVDPWGADGGRVYSTAMLCKICQVILTPVEPANEDQARAKAAAGAPAVKAPK